MVPIGVTHISLPLHQIPSREQEEREQTYKRTICLGLTQVQKESYVTLRMCRLTLVWTLAKLPQSYWNADSSWLDLLSLVWTLSHVDSSLCCPVSNGYSRHPSPTPHFSVPFCLLSDRHPLTTSGHVEIAGPKPFVWFRAKTDKGIVCLADHLHSVTHININQFKINTDVRIIHSAFEQDELYGYIRNFTTRFKNEQV